MILRDPYGSLGCGQWVRKGSDKGGPLMRSFAQILALGVCVFLSVALHSDAQASREALRLATTTSTADSGLLEAILPAFEAQHPVRVDVVAVGTGQALALGRAGDVDVLLVHARVREEEFIAAGQGRARMDVMFNDFVLVGPHTDPAGISGTSDILAALRRIAAGQFPFASRGDDSGTHSKEAGLWLQSGESPVATERWYHSLGQGMGATLQYANERGAYSLSDRGTFLSQRSRLESLKIVVGGASIAQNDDIRMRNPYAVVLVSGEKRGIRTDLAKKFADWLVAPHTQQKIASYRSPVGEKTLFYPAHPILTAPRGGDIDSP